MMMDSIYLRGKVYVHLCTVQIGVRLSTWYVRYNNKLRREMKGELELSIYTMKVATDS